MFSPPVFHAPALIGVLLRTGSPFAVPRSVWSIIVDALQAHSLWAVTHIRKELCRIFHPLCTHVDASPAIIWVAAAPRIRAALLRVVVRLQRQAYPPTLGSAVPKRARQPKFVVQATATGNMAIPQVAAGDHMRTAAGAHALPHHFRWVRRSALNHCQATEFLAGKIDHLHAIFIAKYASRGNPGDPVHTTEEPQ